MMARISKHVDHCAPARRAGDSGSGPRRGWPVVLGVVAALALTSCTGSPGGGTTEEATSPVASATETGQATETGRATESAEASPTESGTPTASGAPGDGTTGGDGATQTHSTEGGYFQWTLPAGWTIGEELAGPDTTDAYGVKNERWVFQNPERTAIFTADTGIGPTDNDGAKADVVEVVETQPLDGLPDGTGEGGQAWYRAAILKDNGLAGDQGFFDGEDYRLAVQVVTVSPGTDPEAAGEDFHNSWYYMLPAAEGVAQGTASFLQGHITQSDAEAITGNQGEAALRSVLDTEEYAELKDVATSLEVTAP